MRQSDWLPGPRTLNNAECRWLTRLPGSQTGPNNRRRPRCCSCLRPPARPPPTCPSPSLPAIPNPTLPDRGGERRRQKKKKKKRGKRQAAEAKPPLKTRCFQSSQLNSLLLFSSLLFSCQQQQQQPSPVPCPPQNAFCTRAVGGDQALLTWLDLRRGGPGDWLFFVCSRLSALCIRLAVQLARGLRAVGSSREARCGVKSSQA